MDASCVRSVVFGLLVVAATANAADIKAQAGQPFCQSQDDLREYLVTLIQHNVDQMHRLDCGGPPKGARLTILEDLPSDSETSHVARIRAFILGGGGSVTGYTLIVKP